MPDDPNKNMDKMLRTYAKRLSEVPLPPLHPATRKMLMNEARRIHGQTAANRVWWRANFPRIAFASAFCVVVLLSVAVLRTPKEEKLASAEAQPRAVQLPRLKESLERNPAARTTPDPVVQSLIETERATPLRQEQLSRESRAPNPEERQAHENSLKLADASVPAVTSIAAAAEAPRPTPPPPSPFYARGVRSETVAIGSDLTNLGAAMRTPFVQTNLSNVPLLRSFQLEQLGDDVSLVDADGSVFVGEMVTNLSPATLVMDRVREAPTALFINATGTSRTLGESVVFQGRYYSRTNPTPGQPATLRRAPQQGRHAIIGRAMIGGTNEVPVRAISVER